MIAFHSYKGGTGKTLLSVNLAAMLANTGKKTCLLDLDFRAPSLGSIFKTGKLEYWLNDYLDSSCKIEKILEDCSSICGTSKKLFVGFANPSTEAIQKMESKDRRWEMKALSKLLSLKGNLLEKTGFDYVIFDTSPGLEYCSINAIVSSDVVFVVSTLDKSDMEGTKRMIYELYELFEKRIEVVLNKVPFDLLKREKLDEQVELFQFPMLTAIPCSCDLLSPEGEYFFALNNPYHIFMEKMKKIITAVSQKDEV